MYNKIIALCKILSIALTSLLVLEIYFRLPFLVGDTAPPKTIRLNQYRYFDTNGAPRYPTNLKAWHSDSDGGSHLIKINKFGFRGSEPKTNTNDLIALVGDSVVFSGNLTLDNSLPHYLEKTLNKNNQDQSYQVLNFGVTDIGIESYFSKIKNHVAKFNPNKIILGFYLNDFVIPQSVALGLENLSLQDQSYKLYSIHFIKLVLKQTVTLWHARSSNRFMWVEDYQSRDFTQNLDSFKKLTQAAATDWGSAWIPQNWDKFKEELSELKQLSSTIKSDLYLLILPSEPQVSTKATDPFVFYPQHMAKLIAEELKVPIIDPLMALRKSNTKDLFVDQCHLTTYGSEIIAKEIVKQL